MEVVSVFRYQPLPPIASAGPTPPFTRLLWLAPGSGDEPLVGRLWIVNLEAVAKSYEALSYNWGTEPPQAHLWLQDGGLPIRPNLATALTSLRPPNQGRVLWVDAICIDQANLDERARQVQYMRIVYKNAAVALAWIGAKSPGVGIAFETLRRMATFQELAAFQRDHDNIDPYGEAAVSLWNMVMDDMPPESLQHVRNLWKRPYFERCWCVQELAVAEEAIIKCEDLEMPFIIAAGSFFTIGILSEKTDLVQTLHMWHNIWQAKHQLKSASSHGIEGSMGRLLLLLENTRSFKASDIRDKLFSMLGISDEGLSPVIARTQILGTQPRWLPHLRRAATWVVDAVNSLGPEFDFARPEALKVDYRKPAVDVYIGLTRWMMRMPPRLLDVLDHVMHNEDPEEVEYPSWVARWFEPSTCQVMDGRIFRAGFCPGRFPYFAEIQDNPLRGAPLNPRVLSVDGFMVDSAEAVSDIITFKAKDVLCRLETIEQAWDQLFPFPFTPPPQMKDRNGQTLDLAFCKALFAHPAGELVTGISLGDSSTPPDLMDQVRYRFAQGDRRSRQFLHHLNQARLMDDDESFQLPQGFVRFLDGVATFSRNRRVFVTRDGRLGLGPQAMRPGDKIIVLFGGQLPYVVRPKAGYHTFVGQCYIVDEEVLSGKWTASVRVHNTGPAKTTFHLR